jgi:tripartite-type tricarboxylate transporter receptor subunit TctC
MRHSRNRRSGIQWFGTLLTLGAIAGVLVLSCPCPGSAANYPVKPLRIIVPFQAGGQTDLTGRTYAQFLPKYLGQPVVIENNPASGAVAGTLDVGKSKPDGYTLGLFADALLVSKYTLPIAPDYKDFEPVCQVLALPYVIAVSEKSGFKTLKEMVDFGKKNPKTLTVGINPGAGSHLYTAIMMNALGIDPNYIPAKSGAERRTALAGGHIQVSVDTMASFRSFVDAKKIFILAVTSNGRVDMYKDVPTFKELGSDVVIMSWEGIFAPKGTPKDVIKTLEAAFEKTAKDKELIETFRKNLEAPDFMNAEALNAFMVKQDAKIKATIDDLGLTYKPGK